MLPSSDLNLILLIVLLVASAGLHCSACPHHHAKPIPLGLYHRKVIKTWSVGHTRSIGTALQFFVGQMTRINLFPRMPITTWICWPVMISPQTRQ
jgi:hypothetical protein